VLDNSKSEFISLEQEIATLKLYLELEKMRFDDSFNFQIEIDKLINPTVFVVPPMMIQPVLENAIWHGLAPLKENGLLKLSFGLSDKNILICRVEDNGIGRAKAAEIAERRIGHQSTGVKNLQERINLINSVSLIKIDYKVFDLFDPNDNPNGTKVELHIKYSISETNKGFKLKIFGKKIFFKLKRQNIETNRDIFQL